MKTTPTTYNPCDLVIFGATGDLSRRKLLPALYELFINDFIPAGSNIIGVGRQKLDKQEFIEIAASSIRHSPNIKAGVENSTLESFLALLNYIQLNVSSNDGWGVFGAQLKPNRVRLFYMALSSSLFTMLCTRLANEGLVNEHTRLVVEKPIGHDLQSAQQLNQHIHSVFDEHQIFRIDHYLGKETVQNLMALRFANALFEPLWNARFIDHIQITVAENIGVEGRGSYYDKTGAMRDMMQNHLLQLLCLTAMEPPYTLSPDSVRDEKLKTLRSLESIDTGNAASTTVRGQYVGGKKGASYLEDVDNPESNTESYVAVRTHINNWRWAGTPFYLRTGKALSGRLSEIAVSFKKLPHSIFDAASGEVINNQLVIRVQPDESIVLHIMIKDPKRKSMGLVGVPLDMTFAETLGANQLSDAYERLLLDVIRNDQTLFMRHDEVEAAWGWIDPIIAAWEETGQSLHYYQRGSDGPEDALRLIGQHGDRSWRSLSS